MTMEELYGFGKTSHPQGFYNNHSYQNYYKYLKNHMVSKQSIATYCNIYIPEVLPKQIKLPYYTSTYPHHKAKLQFEHQEGIRCHECGSVIPIFRHIPRLSKDLVLSNRYSTYHPQGSSSCRCDALAVLVSHKGIPHIYSDSKWELITYFQNHEIRHSDFVYSELPKEINFRLNRVPEDKFERTCMITLRDMNRQSEIGMIIPSAEVYSSTILNQSTEHLRRYAYTFSLLIYTRYHIYLPNGVVLETRYPEIRKYLSSPTDKKMPKFSRDHKIGSLLSATANHTEEAEALNEFCCRTYNLPLVPLKYYQKNIVTYLQFIQSVPLYRYDKVYTNIYIHFKLRKLKRMISQLARQVLLTDNLLEVVRFTKDRYHPQPLKIPPKQAYFATSRLLYGED